MPSKVSSSCRMIALSRNRLVRQIRRIAKGVEQAPPKPATRTAEPLVRMLMGSRDAFSNPLSIKCIDSTSIVA